VGFFLLGSAGQILAKNLVCVGKKTKFTKSSHVLFTLLVGPMNTNDQFLKWRAKLRSQNDKFHKKRSISLLITTSPQIITASHQIITTNRQIITTNRQSIRTNRQIITTSAEV
jgi:hypothetical protein